MWKRFQMVWRTRAVSRERRHGICSNHKSSSDPRVSVLKKKVTRSQMTLMYHFYKTAPWFSFSSFWHSLFLVGASCISCIINLWLPCASCDCTLSEKNCTTKRTSIMMLTIFNSTESIKISAVQYNWSQYFKLSKCKWVADRGNLKTGAWSQC